MKLFDILFKHNKKNNTGSIVCTLNGYPSINGAFNQDLYEISLVRGIVHRIAIECSKVEPTVVRMNSNHAKRIYRIIAKRPNEFMTPSQFYYRIATIYEIENNAYIVPILDKYGEIEGLYPVAPSLCKLVARETDGEMFIVFTYGDGTQQAMEYRKVGHIKRMQYKNDFFGESNSAFNTTANLLLAQEESSSDAINNNSNLRFMGKLNSQVADDEDFKEQQNILQRLNMNGNKSGIFLYDDRYESFKTIENKPILLDADQKKAIDNSAYNYWNINEDILQNKYTEDTWNAFYESEIEPFFIQIGEVIGSMFYTPNQLVNGNGIFMSSNRLQYASNKTKVDVAKEFFDRGLFTVNQALELLNLPPLPDGDIRYIRAEYIPQTEQSGKGVDENDETKATFVRVDNDSSDNE